jgi:hypothetical protein
MGRCDQGLAQRIARFDGHVDHHFGQRVEPSAQGLHQPSRSCGPALGEARELRQRSVLSGMLWIGIGHVGTPRAGSRKGSETDGSRQVAKCLGTTLEKRSLIFYLTSIAMPALAPDLQLFIRRSVELGPVRLTFQVLVQDPSLGPKLEEFGPVLLQQDPGSYFQQELNLVLSELAGLAEKGGAKTEIAERRLESIGTTLFRQLPEGLQARLWDLKGRAETLQILSDEPNVPWEMMRLQRRGTAGWEQGPFLCEAFAVTRWLLDRVEVVELPVRDVALVVPGSSKLPATATEKEDVLALAGPERAVQAIEPTYLGVTAALRSGEHDAWHFSGHGSAYATDANRMPLELDGDQPLRPEDVHAHGESLGRRHPLVFLNGCETGRGGFSLLGLGGWAQALLEAGAGAFLGTLWPVKDQKARAFAHAFYAHFLGGEPIGEAVRQARREVKERFPGDPSWLAYTVFAHPLAACLSGGSHTRAERPSPLELPVLSWRREVSPPGALLRAEYGVVPFHAREQEIEDLYAWSMDGAPVGVRLYTGPGGMGKTRLALEAAARLRAEGWRAGLLKPDPGRSAAETWKALARPGDRVLAVVDYAETRRDLLVPLLREMYRTDQGPIRLILLARAALDWWEQLKTEGDGVGELLSGPATSRRSLTALALTAEQRDRSFRLAGEAFAKRLSQPPPTVVPENLAQPLFDRVLILHTTALAGIDGVPVQDEDGVLDYLLDRERRYWEMRAGDRRLPPSIVSGIGRGMAAITLGGGVQGEQEAVEVLRTLRAFDGVTGDTFLGVARLLHECYPGDRWIEPILPDLLGEHLVQREMERGADELLDLVLGPAGAQ